MKLWIDDVRPAPKDYIWIKSVNEAIIKIVETELGALLIEEALRQGQYTQPCGEVLASIERIELIDIDHDAGEFVSNGGDYIKLLDWLEETHRDYPIHIHSMNPVGVANMRAIIQKNGWEEV
jgi:hypothetical protein